ncbi:MAG: Ig-like domain-containing protein [Rubrivivax sp.]|nr:Ig-like domain-containing protein [Rubrivivax sp.]
MPAPDAPYLPKRLAAMPAVLALLVPSTLWAQGDSGEATSPAQPSRPAQPSQPSQPTQHSQPSQHSLALRLAQLVTPDPLAPQSTPRIPLLATGSESRHIDLGTTLSHRDGVLLSGAIAARLGESAASGLVFSLGIDGQELLLNTAWQWQERQRLLATIGQLRQRERFDFASGSEQAYVRQHQGGLSYRYRLGTGWLQSLRLDAYGARTASRELGAQLYAQETASVFELWSDPRRIAGARLGGLEVKLGAAPHAGAEVLLGLGRESLSQDFATGAQTRRSQVASIDFAHEWSDTAAWSAGYARTLANERYALGWSQAIGSGVLGLNLVALRGRSGLQDDQQARLSWSLPLGGQGRRAAVRAALGTPANWGRLVDVAAERPQRLPSQVLARTDHTAAPVRLVEVDKTGLPAGSTIDRTSGTIRVPLPVAVSGASGVTRNGAAFDNTGGAFAVAGAQQLLIAPTRLPEPPVSGTDRYVVTLDNVGGGTTLVEVSAERGSVRIQRVTVAAGLLPPALGSFGALTRTFGDPAFTLTAPTSAGTGAFTYTSSQPAVATVSGNTVTIVGAGTTTLTAAQAATATHGAGSLGATLTVLPAPAGLAGFASVTKALGEAPFVLTPPTSQSPAPITYSSSDTLVATVSGPVVTIVGAGTTTLTAAQAAQGNHAGGSIAATLTVGTGLPVLAGFGPLTRTFGDAGFTLAAPTSNSAGALSYTSSNAAVATVSGSTVTIVGAGTTTLTATQAAAGGYGAGTTSATLTVQPALPTLGGFGATSRTFGDAAYALTAPSSTSGGAFTYASSNPAVATVSGSTVTLAGVGTTTITATQAATANFAAASISAPLTVAAAPPTLGTFAPISLASNAAPYTLTAPASTSAGAFSYASSNAGVVTVSGNVVTVVGVGTATLTATQAAHGNYLGASTSTTLAVGSTVPTLGNFGALTKTYGDAAFTLAAPSSNSAGAFSYASSNTAVATVSGNTVTITGAGTTTLTATQAAAGGFSSAGITATLTVNGANPSLGAFGPFSRNFGDAPFAPTAPSSTSPGAFSFTSGNTAVATVSGNTVTIVGAGTALLTAQQAASGGYNAASTSVMLTVAPAVPTLGSFGPYTKTYGDAAFALTPPASNSAGTFTYTSDNLAVATVSGNTVTAVGAGSATITATQAAAGNYTAASATATLTVAAVAPTLGGFGAIGKTYGDAPFTLTAPGSNSAGSFSYASSNTAVATVSGSIVTVVGAGTATLTATQAAAGNYGSGAIAATLTVTTATPTLGSFTVPGKTFGDAAFALTAPTSNSAGSFSYASSNTAVATVSGNTVTITGAGSTTITATQAAAGHYASASTTGALVVAAATPTLGGFSALGKTLGDAPFALSAPSSNSAGSFTYTSSNTAVATVSGNTVTLQGVGSTTLTATQAAAGHYGSAAITATLTVGAQAPTLGSFSVAGKTYGDADFALTPPTSNSAGAFSYTSSDTAVATVSGSTVTVVGAGTATITASQAADGSYATAATSATLTVSKKTPTLAALPDLSILSWDYSEICISDDTTSCPSQTHALHVPYTLTLGAPTANSADIGVTSGNPAVVLRIGDAMTVGNAGVMQGRNAQYYSGPSWSIRSAFTVTYPRSTPASTTVTVTRAATPNFTAVSRTFTLTITPDNGNGYCFNGGNLVLLGGSGLTECVCPPEYAGARCEMPADL